MRVLSLTLVCLAACANAGADRLIATPTATKLTVGSIRYERIFGLNSPGAGETSFLVPLDETFEVEYRSRSRVGERAETIDLYATIVSPFNGLSPGIGFGMRDVLSQTLDGRRAYGAITFREPYTVGGLDIAADVTLGVFVGSRTTAFLGINIPLGTSLRLLAEHDGIRFSAGLQLTTLRRLEFRLETQSNLVLGSVRYGVKF